MQIFLFLALFSPLASALIAACFGAKKKQLWIGILSSSLITLSFLSSIVLLFVVYNNGAFKVELMDWISVGNFSLSYGFVVDELSSLMLFTVSLVSSAVHFYSIGYMEHDKGFNRYFSYLGAFVFSMLVLVLSDNFLGLFIGWEGVGLCSWLLIGFWYHKNSASWAANEAFIMNRIADLGMLLGIFLIYWQTGSLEYDIVFSKVSTLDLNILIAISCLLFVGAMGKSAQFPLHTWLADAMEGPTPVSALIHAATMVTAGVYLVIRANPIYNFVPEVSIFIASLGAFVAIFAASMALVNNDLKRIIAYSTLSQLGYMFVAAGLGAYWIALFHLITHAFFKSLLFLGAGNVMHAMNDELNIKKMGGLFESMKYTAILMAVASIALSGIYPFAGFFSKDKILESAFASEHYLIWGVLLVAAVFTAFYSFRLIMLVFFTEKKYTEFAPNPHEAHNYVLLAMLPLGVLAIISGWFGGYLQGFILKLLPNKDLHISHNIEIFLIILTSFLAISSIVFAIFIYHKKGGFPKFLEERLCYKILINQYYIPAIYKACIIKPYEALANLAWKFDEKIIDTSVDGVAYLLHKLGFNSDKMQDGDLSNMLRLMVAGVVILLSFALYFSFAVSKEF